MLRTLARASNRKTRMGTMGQHEGHQGFAATYAPPKFAYKHPNPFNLNFSRARKDIYEISIHEPNESGVSSKMLSASQSLERVQLRQRPSSAVPLGSPKKKVRTKSAFRSKKEMAHHIEHLYNHESSITPAVHFWPDKRRTKLSRRLPNRVLKSLYGSKS